MSTAPSTFRFRPDIEGLRALAVFVVAAYHGGLPGFSGGFVGVDIFFVLSGYLITGLLVHEIQSSGRFSVLQFYARRVRRLLPASTLMLAATLAAALICLAPIEAQFANRAARATSVYASNFFFATNAADYFAANVETNPFLHTWSLAVEEQFYLFWPLLILAGLVWFRSRRALFLILATLSVASFAFCLRWTANTPTDAFFLLPARAWEFGAGGLAALPSLVLGRRLSLALGWLGLLILLASCSLLSGGPSFPGALALLPTLGTILALQSGRFAPSGGIAHILNTRPFQILGKLSYSWYLWHWPALVLAKALWPAITLPGRLLVVAASLGIAALAHHFVENPIRFHPTLTASSAYSLGLGAVLTLSSFAVSTLALRQADRLANSPRLQRFTLASKDISSLDNNQCVSLGGQSRAKLCQFGSSAPVRTLVLFGDSHTVQWFNGFEAIAQRRNWRLYTLFKFGCPSVSIRSPKLSSGEADQCDAWRQESLGVIRRLHPDYILLGNSTTYLGIQAREGKKPLMTRQAWLAGLDRTLQALSGAAGRVVVLRDTPTFPIDIPVCLSRPLLSPSACSFPQNFALDAELPPLERATLAAHPFARYLDMNDLLCSAGACPVVTPSGQIIYRDTDHLTGAMAVALGPTLEARLVNLLN